ncbi:MAG: hypothetical protein GEV00_00485 [Actinophytocola sp.]|nr:hypothetical protein [Actinophytocola sp.]
MLRRLASRRAYRGAAARRRRAGWWARGRRTTRLTGTAGWRRPARLRASARRQAGRASRGWPRLARIVTGMTRTLPLATMPVLRPLPALLPAGWPARVVAGWPARVRAAILVATWPLRVAVHEVPS